jgi:peptide/nickel transport system substrate-binding protein
MRRRTLLQYAAAMALATPAIAQPKSLLRFVPHADLASLDPVWTTADITRNYSLAVFDTLFGIDAKFDIHPQMLAGFTTSADGLLWELTLRDGLLFHDGSKVTARDCVASITRFASRDAIGTALGARITEITAPSDRLIRIRLKSRFNLLPNALAAYASAIMPEHLAKTDPMKAIPEAIGSGPFRFMADERIPGAKVVFEKFAGYVPRGDGVPSFTAGPKIVHFDRMEWTVMPDAGTAMSALLNN